MNIRNGAGLFLETLVDEGVGCIFGNPGTTELPLMDALVDEKRIDYVLCLQESVAIGAAEGYAFAGGGVGMVNVHVAPGLGNAMGMLYNAKRAGTPLVVTAGNQGGDGNFTEPILWDDLARIAEPLVKWSYEVRRVQDLEQAVRRAVKTALAPPTGPVFLSLPGDVMLAPGPGALRGRPTRIDARFPAAGEAVRRAAEMLARAERPVFVAGAEVTRSGAEAALARLAEALGARVWGDNRPNTLPFDLAHPLYMGELSNVIGPLVQQLEGADVIFFAGTETYILSFPPGDAPLLPTGARTVHLHLNPWEIGKCLPADAALLGDPKTTLERLLPAIEERMDAPARERARKRRAEAEAEAAALRAKDAPAPGPDEAAAGMSVPAFQAALGEALPEGCALVDEALTSGFGGLRRAAAGKPRMLFGTKGGGIGLGLPTALGVKKARPELPVVCVSGDGSALYTIQSLWTAARYRIGAVWVIANNGAYRILKERVLRLDGKANEMRRFVAMDLADPSIDFPGMAKSLGVEAVSAATPRALKDALRAGLGAGGPLLVDAKVRNEEL